ncbi:MAG TPA: multidrug ABC transporter substrate-binding protein [Actinobacteria bacterium]|nr:multidrug ABC transporter substrate-binding protein [Actinomycetota bacterium]
MEFSETVGTAFEALRLNKMRTLLASLGIVIGIAAVIALISLGQSSQKVVESQIQSLGSNLLTVSPGAQTSGAVRGASGGGTTLTYADAKAIMTSRQVTAVANVSPELSQRAQVVAGRNNTNTQVIGSTPAYEEVRKITLGSGRFITQQEVDAMAKVVVLGPDVVAALFGEGAEPVGQAVRINNMSFRVVGVTESKGGSGFMNQDDRVFVPLLTAQKILFGVDNVGSISIAAKSEDVMNQARNEVGYLLLARHNLSSPAQADFSIMSQEDVLGAASQVTGTFTTLLSGIAMISLLVGGIGIMNIMMITVIERTREIGLRKSLGARNRDITAQFLVESIILTVGGGVVGIALGVLLSFGVGKLMGLPFYVSTSSILLSMGVSGGVGIVFGSYPARKAAHLSPIDALRYE